MIFLFDIFLVDIFLICARDFFAIQDRHIDISKYTYYTKVFAPLQDFILAFLFYVSIKNRVFFLLQSTLKVNSYLKPF